MRVRWATWPPSLPSAGVLVSHLAGFAYNPLRQRPNSVAIANCDIKHRATDDAPVAGTMRHLVSTLLAAGAAIAAEPTSGTETIGANHGESERETIAGRSWREDRGKRPGGVLQ
jgi:hypothetical protein